MKPIITIILLLIAVFIGRFWQEKENREWAQFHQTIMSTERFMELNPYFSNHGSFVQIPMDMPGPMFDVRNVSYRLFIRPFAKDENGNFSPPKDNRDIPEEWVDICVESNSGFEDWTPIRQIKWTGKSLLIEKDFSEWELENPNNPDNWNLRLIRKGGIRWIW